MNPRSTAWIWFSAFLLNAFVSRVNRRSLVRTVRLSGSAGLPFVGTMGLARGGSAPLRNPPTIALLRSAREAGSHPFPRCRRGLMADHRISRRARGLARGREPSGWVRKWEGMGSPPNSIYSLTFDLWMWNHSLTASTAAPT